ncbi:glycosyltransferase family 4 protein [Acuticoccus yangtzensis]|uniref:glycosyltransferase family 4 protein n=1 Tax=Acuticoccus yangtzensis TaxID=1443441 RepID=UPI0009497DEF|nr:glycosyltransferase family 1 protein [Acuticoccus yangtzensis]
MTRPLILFDLTRLVSASGRSAPTGIERVELAYAKWLSGLTSADVRFVVTMQSVRMIADSAVPQFLDRQEATWDGGAQGFSAESAILNVNEFLTGDGAPAAPLLGYLSREERELRRSRRGITGEAPSRSPISSWAQHMAASWAREPLAPLLRQTHRDRPVIYLRASLDRLERPGPIERIKSFPGVRMVNVCHDLIPLDYPEFVRPGTAATCAARVETLAKHADGIISSSHYSAARLRQYLGPKPPKIAVSHIGSEPAPPTAALPPLADKPFFLVVSTIEARKNHMLLLNVWRRLVEDLGEEAPKLVIAGKRGWEAQTPIAVLDRVRSLSSHVYEAGAVPDAALDVLRRNATAVLMPSFVEGFGMPVTEALSVDTPVIASDIPVFREIVGQAAELIDPLDGPSWTQAVIDYAQPGSPRRAAALERARRYEPPQWSDHFREVRNFIEEVGQVQPKIYVPARRRPILQTLLPSPSRTLL